MVLYSDTLVSVQDLCRKLKSTRHSRPINEHLLKFDHQAPRFRIIRAAGPVMHFVREFV
jgi:hypothetical protein